MRVPKLLDAIADVVLAYKPKPKSKAARSRKRKAAKAAGADSRAAVSARPTEAEFSELKRKRDEAIAEIHRKICDEYGLDTSTTQLHVSHASGCYCACPEGPCQHEWDGDEYRDEDCCMSSSTCSRCGEVAFYHDLRCAP